MKRGIVSLLKAKVEAARDWYLRHTRKKEWEVIAKGVSEPVECFCTFEEADRFAWEQNRGLPTPKFSVHHNPRTIEQ
jgi:hypothetical protein